MAYRIARFVFLTFGFMSLSTAAVFCTFGAGVELLNPWGVRSAPPRDVAPPTFYERLPATLPYLAVAIGAWAGSAYLCYELVRGLSARRDTE